MGSKREDTSIVGASVSGMVTGRVPSSVGVRLRVFIIPLQAVRLRRSSIGEAVLVLSLLKFTVLFTTAVGCILVFISSLSRHTGKVKVRGYGNTSSGTVFSVFVCRATLVVNISLILVVVFLFRFRRGVRRLTRMSLSSLFA